MQSGVLDALARAQIIISFAGFLDDSVAWADLVLPDHHPLEAEAALVPAVSPQPAVTISTPFIQPLYDTRPVEQTLAELARKLGLGYQSVTARDIIQPLIPAGRTYQEAAREGGLWLDPEPDTAARPAGQKLEFRIAALVGDPSQFPLQFQPYLSLEFHDGSASHLPWMQELPDPTSSSMWGLPVEIDPGTAAALSIGNGDMVRVESAHGSFEAPAYVHPGAVPGVVSMAIGGGHTHYGRYASRRGANPLSILAPLFERSTGALVMGGTRVRLVRVGGRKGWIQFAAQDREKREFDYR
jgi:anaerobic selenocysteine-containing dehydrogenase